MTGISETPSSVQRGVIIKNDPPVDVVRAALEYNPETGVFTWKRNSPARRAGSVAGYMTNTGYLQIGVCRAKTMAHRLAWIHFYGRPPSGFIDHINGDRLDNRIANLRDVAWATNTQNVKSPRKKEGRLAQFLGVSISASKSKPYKAHLTLNGKAKYIGIFRTPEEAHAAYIEAKRRLHPGCTI